MTVIAWDGHTLAADKQGDCGGGKFATTKIHKINGHLIGGTGDYDAVMTMINWFEKGAHPDDWPKCQADEKRYANLLVISPQKEIFRYEREPFPYKIEDKFFAAGSGKDYATTAMYLGKNAKEAVEITSALSTSCGMGIDTLEL